MNLKGITLNIILLIGIICPILTFSQTLSPKKFKKKLSNEKVILIDVRSPEEFNNERIEGAININVNDSLFKHEIGELDKTKTYFLYCGIGKRSAKALQVMKQEGFKRVFDLEGGLTAWKKRGYKIVTNKLY